MPNWEPGLNELHRNWKRRWLNWLAIYVAGFVVIWAAGLSYEWPFYAWAIGWALVKSFWDEAQFRQNFGEKPDRHRDGSRR